MKLIEVFNFATSGGWTTAGLDVQFKVVNRVLCFQCSASDSDWRYNLRAWGDVYDNSDIEFIGHTGFNELWESVRPIIETLHFDYIVGYSQGAAIALRAHENYFHRFGFEPVQTFLFGCPPSVFCPSRRLLNRFNRVVNIHNANDLVYHIPALIGYDHIGEQVRLPLKGLNKPDSYSWLYWLSGHSAEQYRQAIRRVS